MNAITINSKIKFITLLVLLLTTGFMLTSFVSSNGDKGKTYVVAKKGAKSLSKRVNAELYKAVSIAFGKKPKSVELIKGHNGMYVSWSFNADRGKSEYISVKLTAQNEDYVIDFGGPLAATNCKTNSDCECCKTDCSCSKKNGGQEDCGSSACDKKDTDDDEESIMAMAGSLL